MTFDGRVEHGPSANTTDLSCIDEDKIVHIEIVGRRKVYSEAAYNKVVAHRDRLRDALTEALEELDSLVQRETMSRTKWSQHIVWMEWLRLALQEAEDGND